MRRQLNTAVLLGMTLVATVATADISSNAVISAFRGQLVVSKDELPEGKNDADTIKRIHAASLTELVGEPAGEVTQWHFHYTAFLTKTGASSLRMEFVTADKDAHFAASKSLDGVDPKSAVLTGDITIDEDEGLAKGKTYAVELIGGGNQVVAKQSVTFK
jgi:hypothetical protein